MHRTPINSTSLRSLGYDEPQAILEVEFASGGIYQYYDVSLDDVRNILVAESRGEYFNHTFKASHPHYRRVA